MFGICALLDQLLISGIWNRIWILGLRFLLLGFTLAVKDKVLVTFLQFDAEVV